MRRNQQTVHTFSQSIPLGENGYVWGKEEATAGGAEEEEEDMCLIYLLYQ